jgi:hypothetical protein
VIVFTQTGMGPRGDQLFVPPTANDEMVGIRRVQVAPYRQLLKAFLVRLCVVVTVAVILTSVVELYSYWRYRNFGNDVLEPAVQIDLAKATTTASDREYWKEFEQSNRVVYHQYTLWRRAPYQGKMISIDRDGVRRTMHTRCEGTNFTIWMFGDSVMWGAGAPDAETIPSLVAQDYEEHGTPVCIVNYAEKGWSNTQELVGLVELLKHAGRKPDVVLFYDGGTEAFAAYQSGEADVHSNFAMFRNFLNNWGKTQRASFSYWSQTNTYRLLQRIAAKAPFHRELPGSHTTPLDLASLSQAVIENYQENVSIVDLLAKQYGFRPIFAWYPNLAVGHKQLTPYEQQVLVLQDQQFPKSGSMYQAVYNRGNEILSRDFYNLADSVDDEKDTLYIGISHMRPRGTQIMADKLFEILQGKGSTPSGARNVSPRAHEN